MARKAAVIRWGGHRVLRRSVVQPRVSWLKEDSRSRLTRLSRKAEHTSLILALALTVYVSRLHESLYVSLPKAKQKTVGADRIKYQVKVKSNPTLG
jgi:hypothetical protein